MTCPSFDEERAGVYEADTAPHDHAAAVAHASGRFDRPQTDAARRRLLEDIVTTQEQERRRIAEEIHDGALQAMAVVLLRLGQLKAASAASDEPAVVAQLELSVRDAIGKTRQLIAGLVPRELDDAGLAAAVGTLLGEVGKESGIRCRLEHRLHEEPRAAQRAVAFRITQEAVANARKHANPSRIDVLLESRDAGVGARVADDGIGFAVDGTLGETCARRLGLAAMHQRSEMVGGWLQIESSAQGTAVSFWLPDAISDQAAA
jgi:two-component system NarL family sensor kinase